MPSCPQSGDCKKEVGGFGYYPNPGPQPTGIGGYVSCPCDSNNDSVGLLRAFAAEAVAKFGNKVSVNLDSTSCPASLTLICPLGLEEKDWDTLVLKNSLNNNNVIVISNINLGYSENVGLTYNAVRRGNRASGNLLSSKLVDNQIAAQELAISSGKTFFKVPFPPLSNVDSITAAFGNPTYGQLKCVYSVTLGACMCVCIVLH